jgi:hypothetical protein
MDSERMTLPEGFILEEEIKSQDNNLPSGFILEQPESTKQQPKLKDLGDVSQFAEDIIAPPAHFINQLGFNLPKAILYKLGISYPEAKNPVMNVIAKGAGVAGGVLNPFGKAIQGLGKIPAGVRLTSKILRGAGVGALGGAAYTPTENIVGIPQRSFQAGVGALTGGILTGASEGIQEGVKYLRKLKYPEKLPASTRVSILQQKARQFYGKPIEEAKIKQTQLNWDKVDTRRIINDELRNTDILMNQSISKIDDEIAEAAEKGSLAFQEKLPEFFKSNSKAYAKRLDEISEALSKSKNTRLRQGDAFQIIQKTLQDADANNLNYGYPYQRLLELAEKYNVASENDMVRLIDFKQFKQDIGSIWKTISREAKYGKFNSEDVVAAILSNNWGKWVSQYAPELQKLNDSYRPIILAMKQSARIFKPAEEGFAAETAEKFLKRLGSGKLSGREKKMLSIIEQGTEFSSGVSEISKDIRQLGEKRFATIAQQELKRANLKQQLSNKLNELELKIRENTQSIIENRQALENRLQSLGTRKEHILKLMANRNKGRMIRSAFLIGGAVGTGVIGLPPYIQRLLYGIRNNE